MGNFEFFQKDFKTLHKGCKKINQLFAKSAQNSTPQRLTNF